MLSLGGDVLHPSHVNIHLVGATTGLTYMRARTMLSISLCSVPNCLVDGMVTSALSSGSPDTPDEELPPELGTASL